MAVHNKQYEYNRAKKTHDIRVMRFNNRTNADRRTKRRPIPES